MLHGQSKQIPILSLAKNSLSRTSGSSGPVAQGSLLAFAQALVGGAMRSQTPIVDSIKSTSNKHVFTKGFLDMKKGSGSSGSGSGDKSTIISSFSTMKPTNSQTTISPSVIPSITLPCVDLNESSSISVLSNQSVPSKEPAVQKIVKKKGGERMRKLRRHVHGWRIETPGNYTFLYETYTQWWKETYSMTVKASVSSGSQPGKYVPGGSGSTVSLADINAAIKERKKEEEEEQKKKSATNEEKDVDKKQSGKKNIKQIEKESNKANILPVSLAPAALALAINLTLVKNVQMKGAWVEITRSSVQLPQMQATSIDILKNKAVHFSGFITWIGAEYFTLCFPMPHQLRRVTLKKKGTMLCIRWPSFSLKKGETSVPDPPGVIETVIECFAEDLSPSD
jgi:hypothetical protein